MIDEIFKINNFKLDYILCSINDYIRRNGQDEKLAIKYFENCNYNVLHHPLRKWREIDKELEIVLKIWYVKIVNKKENFWMMEFV